MTLDLRGGRDNGRDLWRETFSLVAVAVGLAGSFFAAGISWSKVDATAIQLETHTLAAEKQHEKFLRKDGQELAELRARLDLILQTLQERKQ